MKEALRNARLSYFELEITLSAYVFRFRKRPQYVPPPSGYKFDAASNLYYVSDMINDPATGTTVQRVTWFDSITGIYKQIDYQL